MTAAVVGVVLDGGGEEGVDEGGLAEARLASDHDGEGGTALRNDLVALVGELGAISLPWVKKLVVVAIRTLAMPIGDIVSAIVLVFESLPALSE